MPNGKIRKNCIVRAKYMGIKKYGKKEKERILYIPETRNIYSKDDIMYDVLREFVDEIRPVKIKNFTQTYKRANS